MNLFSASHTFPRNQRLFLLMLGLIIGGWWLTPSCQSSRLGKLPAEVDYNLHIRPILSDNCYTCHGPDANKREAGLRLDTEEGAFSLLEDSQEKYALVPGQPEASILYHRIVDTDPTRVMPPPESNLSLSEREIALLEKWIAQGAKWKKHWSFNVPEKPAVPEVGEAWGQNEIDGFILARLQEADMEPNPEADKERLLKRLSFDLTGLPPTIELQDKFLTDESPNAYESMVDEMLASPHFGERMAIHWLDVARYADSHGYQDDGLRTMWPWRDWVIHAFNQNYPYDKFVRMQLAGDLFDDPNEEELLATGFNRNHKITQEGGVIDEEYRVEYVTDRTNTFGKAFLAMTLECAKCHDHKYDPISQKDYFSTFAFFNQVPEKGLYGTIDAAYADPPRMEITPEMVEQTLSFINMKDSMPVSVMIMADSTEKRPNHVLIRGNYDAHGEEVDPATPHAILAFDTTRFAPNRLGLANWLLDKENPLASRVFVNRLWQEIFGQGIVKTSGDFGMQGDLPTHLDLLDWLSVDFIENDWDIKRLVKLMVMSATYRQQAHTSQDKLSVDPENLFFASARRNRLGAETIRDHVLASSGLLNPEIGGPSVKPYQPEGLWEAATSGRGSLMNYKQDHGDDLYRRGMYVFIKRTVPPPSMLMFDASNRDQCEVRRLQTNTPLQALVIMNDPHVLEAARVLAETLLLDKKLSLDEQIEQAFRRIVCRYPKAAEKQILKDFFAQELNTLSQDEEQAGIVLEVGEKARNKELEPATVAALMRTVHMIYNLEESITKT
ncbi:MAG: PSD1 and planctomycete cytochrome C domain-containing protein [Bacteroidota bacterium]